MSGAVDPEDLTARARIRDAAFRLFATKGSTTSLREIANAAGVSPGLILHHFGSKDVLATEVAAWAQKQMSRAFVAAPLDGSPTEVADALFARFDDLLMSNPLLAEYIVRSISDGSPEAAAWFAGQFRFSVSSAHVLQAKGVVRPSEDEEVQAAIILSILLAPIAFRRLLESALGMDFADPSDIARWRRGVIELLSNPHLLTPGSDVPRSTT